MAVKQKKERKTLAAMMGEESINNALPSREIHELSISEIVVNGDQPRKHFDEQSLASLAESVKNLGIFQPIVVRKQNNKYQIVAGERRYRAALMAGLETVPVVVKNYNTEEMTEVALVENLQREGLDPIEEALAYQGLMNTYKQTQEMIAVRLGKSRSYIANMMRLLKLSASVQKDLIEGDLTVGQARPLLALRSGAQQTEAAEKIKEGELSARQAEQLVKSMMGKQSKTVKENPHDTAEVRALVDKLKLTLGSPVSIKFRNGKQVQGKIEIAFSSEDELTRLISFMESQEFAGEDETMEFRV
ncbi:ParB/RepB/Spo0J family partition protein [Veillonella caviae]|uniref:ParB/RepB/Spo0J family partition protein n=1 Tax=Veillonella caviae TaxID=248316 RepID=UPI000F8D4B95|nr:ParB/RepB/Spo0J family partition protein [Veillonella caviae]MCF0157612.1 ParB/RepB/Spo0J family partition protein [Veillonella sp.]MCI5708783.1 ParB/RepB/Spo0J family partition protein [Veillonella caviae]MCI6407097.1 ParB/RepB/Spo0J family partition protein [Veillonella caviae]MDY5714719.1 ParB/RepB/Spo0J family partition protein [Veillonella caviae]MDY6224752.1 ParB/RepB/Spo0J family partition protein [Veillonella caviae]